ncbi:hypothetical protein HDU97_001088 [Phlyctochytrium planicorne]|nr:hypothetical protein HDU97_001088 [Phlyctochytrium planicorne]
MQVHPLLSHEQQQQQRQPENSSRAQKLQQKIDDLVGQNPLRENTDEEDPDVSKRGDGVVDHEIPLTKKRKRISSEQETEQEKEQEREVDDGELEHAKEPMDDTPESSQPESKGKVSILDTDATSDEMTDQPSPEDDRLPSSAVEGHETEEEEIVEEGFAADAIELLDPCGSADDYSELGNISPVPSNEENPELTSEKQTARPSEPLILSNPNQTETASTKPENRTAFRTSTHINPARLQMLMRSPSPHPEQEIPPAPPPMDMFGPQKGGLQEKGAQPMNPNLVPVQKRQGSKMDVNGAGGTDSGSMTGFGRSFSVVNERGFAGREREGSEPRCSGGFQTKEQERNGSGYGIVEVKERELNGSGGGFGSGSGFGDRLGLRANEHLVASNVSNQERRPAPPVNSLPAAPAPIISTADNVEEIRQRPDEPRAEFLKRLKEFKKRKQMEIAGGSNDSHGEGGKTPMVNRPFGDSPDVLAPRPSPGPHPTYSGVVVYEKPLGRGSFSDKGSDSPGFSRIDRRDSFNRNEKGSSFGGNERRDSFGGNDGRSSFGRNDKGFGSPYGGRDQTLDESSHGRKNKNFEESRYNRLEKISDSHEARKSIDNPPEKWIEVHDHASYNVINPKLDDTETAKKSDSSHRRTKDRESERKERRNDRDLEERSEKRKRDDKEERRSSRRDSDGSSSRKRHWDVRKERSRSKERRRKSRRDDEKRESDSHWKRSFDRERRRDGSQLGDGRRVDEGSPAMEKRRDSCDTGRGGFGESSFDTGKGLESFEVSCFDRNRRGSLEISTFDKASGSFEKSSADVDRGRNSRPPVPQDFETIDVDMPSTIVDDWQPPSEPTYGVVSSSRYGAGPSSTYGADSSARGFDLPSQYGNQFPKASPPPLPTSYSQTLTKDSGFVSRHDSATKHSGFASRHVSSNMDGEDNEFLRDFIYQTNDQKLKEDYDRKHPQRALSTSSSFFDPKVGGGGRQNASGWHNTEVRFNAGMSPPPLPPSVFQQPSPTYTDPQGYSRNGHGNGRRFENGGRGGTGGSLGYSPSQQQLQRRGGYQSPAVNPPSWYQGPSVVPSEVNMKLVFNDNKGLRMATNRRDIVITVPVKNKIVAEADVIQEADGLLEFAGYPEDAFASKARFVNPITGQMMGSRTKLDLSNYISVPNALENLEVEIMVDIADDYSEDRGRGRDPNARSLSRSRAAMQVYEVSDGEDVRGSWARQVSRGRRGRSATRKNVGADLDNDYATDDSEKEMMRGARRGTGSEVRSLSQSSFVRVSRSTSKKPAASKPKAKAKAKAKPKAKATTKAGRKKKVETESEYESDGESQDDEEIVARPPKKKTAAAAAAQKKTGTAAAAKALPKKAAKPMEVAKSKAVAGGGASKSVKGKGNVKGKGIDKIKMEEEEEEEEGGDDSDVARDVRRRELSRDRRSNCAIDIYSDSE